MSNSYTCVLSHVEEWMMMPKKIRFTDNAKRLEEVTDAMRETKSKRLYERLQCIHLLLLGESLKNIAKILNRGADTIGDYVKAYCSHGLEGLQLQQSPGRPKRLSSEQEQELYQTVVEKTPADVGFPANMNWTALLIRDWVKSQFQVQYSERGTRELLYRLGFSYTRPTYTLAKADPQKQEVFKQEFEVIKKIAAGRN
jgi:transposase